MAEALTEFNLARKDSRWASQALLHMVELYLNPEGDAMWAEKQARTQCAAGISVSLLALSIHAWERVDDA